MSQALRRESDGFGASCHHGFHVSGSRSLRRRRPNVAVSHRARGFDPRGRIALAFSQPDRARTAAWGHHHRTGEDDFLFPANDLPARERRPEPRLLDLQSLRRGQPPRKSKAFLRHCGDTSAIDYAKPALDQASPGALEPYSFGRRPSMRQKPSMVVESYRRTRHHEAKHAPFAREDAEPSVAMMVHPGGARWRSLPPGRRARRDPGRCAVVEAHAAPRNPVMVVGMRTGIRRSALPDAGLPFFCRRPPPPRRPDSRGPASPEVLERVGAFVVRVGENFRTALATAQARARRAAAAGAD
jgi:hypothetical protein